MSDPGNPQPPQYPTQPYGQPPYGAPPPPPPPGYQPTQPYGPPPGYGPPPPGYGGAMPPAGPGGPGVPVPPGGGKRRGGLYAGIGLVVAVVLAVLAYFLFTGGSSGASTPRDVVKKYLEAGKTLDVAKAKSVMCRADQSLPQLSNPDQKEKVVSYTIGTTAKKDSSHATVKVSYSTVGNSTPQSVDLPVKKEGGSWKVCVTDLIAALPSTLPTSLASNLPTSLPTELPSLPTSLPSNLPTVSTCADASNPLTTAATYMTMAGFGLSAQAQGCVYQDTVPTSVTASLSGISYFPITGADKSGGNGHGPKAVYDFQTPNGSKKVTVTTTKEPDGKYYVTDVQIL